MSCESGFLVRSDFQRLLDVLLEAGYRCVGPQLRDGAIVFDNVENMEELPIGLHDSQAPGRYRIQRDESPRCFAWANGPQALKPLLFTSRELLWKACSADNKEIEYEAAMPSAVLTAVIGVRACDLAALRLQDQHFLEGDHPDPFYAERRSKLFLIAVNCTHPADTCFCVSTGDGPEVTSGYDLSMHELDDGFVMEAGTPAGAGILRQLPLAQPGAEQQETVRRELADAAAKQTRKLPSRNLRDVLFANLDHPRWHDVAGRCLSCGNCTYVCPTCFCYSETEQPALDGACSEHYRQWDSCFTSGHSYIHGIVIRSETRLRYRQWLTHKLGSWHDQYGRSGCVGCGRCITWCPAEIDITEEAGVIGGGRGDD